MLEVNPLDLPGLIELHSARITDERGFFSEVWNRSEFAEAGIDVDFVQDNHSCSARRGTLRGLHYQEQPAAQAKLVRVTRGSVFDVAVDIRQGSPFHGQWAGLILSADRWNQLFIPEGFAHGFLTLEDNTEVQYKVSGPYRAELDRVIRYDDAAVGIEWPDVGCPPILSDKDRAAPLLSDARPRFTFS